MHGLLARPLDCTLLVALLAFAACSSKLPDAPAADAARGGATITPTPEDAAASSLAIDASSLADAAVEVVPTEVSAADTPMAVAPNDVATAATAETGGLVATAAGAMATRVTSEATTVTLAATASDGTLRLQGFPGVSADGMHLALAVGDARIGPLVLRITRIDGSTLLEKPLLEADELEGEPDEAREAILRRRIGARATAAERILTKAGMRSMVSADAGRTVVVSGEQLTVSLPGFAPGRFPRTPPDRACATATELRAVFADNEHGLVVAQVAHAHAPDCPESASEDWRIFPLTRLP